MDLRDRVNRGLAKATGYQLVKAPEPGRPSRPGAPKRAGAPKKRAGLLPDYDENTKEIWDLVRSRTMTGHGKVRFLSEAVRYVVRHDIPGAFLECGVWRGGSMLAVAHTLARLGVRDRDLYLFDTFAGMSEPTERDVYIRQGQSAEEFLSTQRIGGPIWRAATLDDVKAGFDSVDYPAERIHYVEGKVEDTVPGRAPDQIAILRLDTDWYESTKHELEHLYRRLGPRWSPGRRRLRELAGLEGRHGRVPRRDR